MIIFSWAYLLSLLVWLGHKWSCPSQVLCIRGVLSTELHHCTGTYRITPVDVNSRPSSCLTNFLLAGNVTHTHTLSLPLSLAPSLSLSLSLSLSINPSLSLPSIRFPELNITPQQLTTCFFFKETNKKHENTYVHIVFVFRSACMHLGSGTQLTLTMSVSQYCAHQASRWCRIHVAKSGDYFVKMGNEWSTTTLNWMQTWTIKFFFILQENCKRIGRELWKLRVFRDCYCTFGARVRKTAGARNWCISELLVLKGLNRDAISIKKILWQLQWLVCQMNSTLCRAQAPWILL